MQVDDEHLSLTDQKDQVRDPHYQMGLHTPHQRVIELRRLSPSPPLPRCTLEQWGLCSLLQ